MTAEDVKQQLRDALDGIELLNNVEREHLIDWADSMRSVEMWGLPGTEILVGIHNKCVFECRNADPTWDKAGFIVVWARSVNTGKLFGLACCRQAATAHAARSLQVAA